MSGIFRDDYDSLRLPWVLAVIFGSVVGVTAVVMAIAVVSMRSYGRGACATWGRQSGFPTKFVLIGWADSGTCLARAPNGQWVLNTKIVQFIQAAANEKP